MQALWSKNPLYHLFIAHVKSDASMWALILMALPNKQYKHHFLLSLHASAVCTASYSFPDFYNYKLRGSVADTLFGHPMLSLSHFKTAPVASLFAVLLLSSIFDLSHATSLSRRATVCNGFAQLCSQGYGNVTYVGAHDSYAIGSTSQLGANQDQSVTQQLEDGIRMLQMQAHVQNGQIYLCHTSCTIYNGGPLQTYLTTVKSWLASNPNEVVTLLIVNSENLPASQYDTVFKAVGLDAVSYVPTTTPVQASSWPTLGSMIDSGKRLVTFLDNGADPTVPYLLDEFTNIWETAFDVTNPTFDCNVNRTKGNTNTQMYLINHFLDTTLLGQLVPNAPQLNVTNAATGAGSLGAQVATCVAQNTRPPNFMLVDYYEFGAGSVFQVAASLNGVAYNPSSPIAIPSATAATGTSNAASPKIGLPVFAGEQVGALLIVMLSILVGAFGAL